MTRMDNGALPLLRLEARSAPAYTGPTAHQIMVSFGGDPTRWPGHSPLPSLTPGVTAKRSVA